MDLYTLIGCKITFFTSIFTAFANLCIFFAVKRDHFTYSRVSVTWAWLSFGFNITST